LLQGDLADVTFLKPSQKAVLFESGVAAISEAISNPYDTIKLKVSIGKNFIYRAPGPHQLLTLQEVQAKNVPRDVGCVQHCCNPRRC